MKEIIPLLVQAGLPEEFAVVTRSDRPDLADYQCNGALASSKKLGKNPRDIAEEVLAAWTDDRFELSIAGPGFINIKVRDDVLVGALDFPQPPERKGQLKILDFGGPNVAKAMHVGHLRSLIIGSSLYKILAYQGYDVISDIHWGDWGHQMGLILAAFHDKDLQAPGAYRYRLEYLQDVYPKASARSKVDPDFLKSAHELTLRLQREGTHVTDIWRGVLRATQESVMSDLETLGVEFDLYKGESSVGKMLPGLQSRLQASGLLKESNGASVIDVKIPNSPPLIFKNSEGVYLYAATDLATIIDRVESTSPRLRETLEIIYVVDLRQSLHFQQVFDVSDQMGYVVKLTHAGFGTVQGPDGKPLKTRAGGVPVLRDLLDEAVGKALVKNPDPEVARRIAVAAIKFNDLQNKRTNNYPYDIDRALAHEGKTGPYLLYQCVRMNKILEKRTASIGPLAITCDEERQIILDLLEWNNLLNRVEETLSPHLLAEYLYSLAQKFSALYAKHSIGDTPSRLCLILLLHSYMAQGLALLGIDIVEEM